MLGRLRWLIGFFIFGLFFSGATAIPLETEVGWLVQWTDARAHLQASSPSLTTKPPAWAEWMCRVQDGLKENNRRFPFMGYGGDWLAFGHFMLGLVFVWAWKDPVRKRWLFDFGLIACSLVIPYALICGEARGIPLWWRFIDCSFGVLGAVPLWWCRSLASRLELIRGKETQPAAART